MRGALAIGAALLAALAGCSEAVPPDPGLEGLSLTKVAPDTIIPGTLLVVSGASFVDDEFGSAVLRLKGTSGGGNVDVSWPATFVDFDTLTVAVDGEMVEEMGGDATFNGLASVEYLSAADGETYGTDEIGAHLEFRVQLTPVLTGIMSNMPIYVNHKIVVDGSGFLLGGEEGQTVARLSGCFREEGFGSCVPIAPVEVPMTPVDPLNRSKATFAFEPKIAGIQPGEFEGQVAVINQQKNKAPIADAEVGVTYTMLEPAILDVCVGEPCQSANLTASLGQYVQIGGGGFVGGEPGHLTRLMLAGQFSRNGEPPANVDITLLPEWVEGARVRYVIDKADAIGMSLNLYRDTGSFTGTITPVINVGSDSVTGQPRPLTFDIGHVKQVVYLDFRPSFVEGLRDFGLRAVDSKIRERAIAVLEEAYRGVNIEFRTTEPTDFALYSHIEISGRDPNNMGLFGYDNTPGKDHGNMRLFDRIGGQNAEVQQLDGYPGFGGVFLRSLMGFSKHPKSLAMAVPGADEVFDKIFDTFRPDVGNEPVRAADLSSVEMPTSGANCPASDRTERIECAIWVLGNLVGGTMAHEIGHSLGLANPDEDQAFHNFGDEPNRLMDSGGARSFHERAELGGQGPGVFCDDEYDYLREVLPSTQPPHAIDRPTCY